MTSWAGSLIYTWRKTELSHCSLTFLDYHIKPPGSLIPNTNRPPMLALSLRNWWLINVPCKFDKIVQRSTGRNFIFNFDKITQSVICVNLSLVNICLVPILQPEALLTLCSFQQIAINTKARGIVKMPMTRIWFKLWTSLIRSLRYYYEKGIMQKVAGGWAKENQWYFILQV